MFFKKKDCFHEWRLIDYEVCEMAGTIYERKFYVLGCDICRVKKYVNNATFEGMNAVGLIKVN